MLVPLNDSDAVRTFLVGNPFVYFKKPSGPARAFWFDAEKAADLKEFDNEVNLSERLGINDCTCFVAGKGAMPGELRRHLVRRGVSRFAPSGGCRAGISSCLCLKSAPCRESRVQLKPCKGKPE